MNGLPFSQLAAGSQLAQVRPAVTTAVTLYIASLRTQITSIKVCNTSVSARVFRLFHDDDAGAFSEGTAVYWDKTVPIGDTIEINALSEHGGLNVAKDGQVGARSDQSSGLTFTLYGVVQGAV